MKGDGRSQQAAGSGNLQPRPPPHIRKPSSDDGPADDVHRSRPNAPEENKGKMSGPVLDQIADIFKGGKGKSGDHSGNLDLFRFRLKYQEVKEQRQELHHFLHHRGDLRSCAKGVRPIKCGEKGIDVSGEQTRTHSRKAKQEKLCLPLSHAQGGDQQGRRHTDKNIFNIGHPSTAFPVAGSRAKIQGVSRRSNQQ